MNRQQYVDGQIPTAENFNKTQDNAELEINSVRQELVGPAIITGLDIALNQDSISISPGKCYNEDGQKITVEDEQIISVSALPFPATGSKWIAISLTYTRHEHGEVFDDMNNSHPFYHDDSFVLHVTDGNSGILNKPTISSDHVVLGDILIDDSKIINVDLDRRNVISELPKVNDRLDQVEQKINFDIEDRLTQTEQDMISMNSKIIIRQVDDFDIRLNKDNPNQEFCIYYPSVVYMWFITDFVGYDIPTILYQRVYDKWVYKRNIPVGWPDTQDLSTRAVPICIDFLPGKYRLESSGHENKSTIWFRINSTYGQNVISEIIELF